MARPHPAHICSHMSGDLIVEVCEADAVYAVVYGGRPIKLRRHNPEKVWQGIKYGKTSFPQPGHAIRLARHLNEVHDTDAFSVVVMSAGRTIPLVLSSDKKTAKPQ